MSMADDFRPHLLITENDVESFENKKQARSKDLGLDRAEHGGKLSTDLDKIVSAYMQVQSTDSLSHADIKIFEVVLHESEKFSNSTFRKFVEKEGLTITAVKDSTHAIVTSSKEKFEKLQRRVNGYRDGKKVNGNFQFIDAFKFPDPVEKHSSRLRELIETTKDFPFDVEIIEHNLLKDISHEAHIQAEKNLLSNIESNGGMIQSIPYVLTDGTRVVRAEIPLGKLKTIANDSLVSRVVPTGFFSTSPTYEIQPQNEVQLDPTVSIDDLPIVAVLDSGVDFPPELNSLVIEHWVPTGATPGDTRHGTCVASKVAFKNPGEQIGTGMLTPRAKILDCNILGKDPLNKKETRPDSVTTETLIRRIQEAVRRFKDVTKIFNLSSSEENPIPGDEISLLGYELDVLTLRYGVKFTISAGNHRLYRSQDSLQDIINDDESRIASPSDSMLNIAVGAIVGTEHKESLSRRFEIAPYSRIGPGFRGFRKPDLVSFSGTMTKTGFVPPDVYAMTIGSNGKWEFLGGTSFSAPDTAGDIAEIAQSVPQQDILLSEALLYHGAEMPLAEIQNQKATRDENAFYGNIYGRGIPNTDVSRYSSASRVTFVHRGTMNKKFKRHIKFLMPHIYDEKFNMRTHDLKVNVTVTCVTQPPVDKTKGADYLGAFISASLHARNSNDKLNTQNPSESDGRKDWDTCFHFNKQFSSFHGGDWEVWLELHTRYHVKDEQEIDYALAITIEDMTGSLDIYDAVRNEVQERFPAVQAVRVPIRS